MFRITRLFHVTDVFRAPSGDVMTAYGRIWLFAAGLWADANAWVDNELWRDE